MGKSKERKIKNQNKQKEKMNQRNENNIRAFNLKLLSAIFYQIFIFSTNDSPSETMKNVFYFI